MDTIQSLIIYCGKQGEPFLKRLFCTAWRSDVREFQSIHGLDEGLVWMGLERASSTLRAKLLRIHLFEMRGGLSSIAAIDRTASEFHRGIFVGIKSVFTTFNQHPIVKGRIRAILLFLLVPLPLIIELPLLVRYRRLGYPLIKII